jgi:putative transposase
MKLVGGAYVQYFNGRFARSGSLWKGRFKSSLIQADSRLLSCYRYVEQTPVRYQLAATPGEYPWSSYCANAFGGNKLIAFHEQLRKATAGSDNRFACYRDYIHCPLSPDELRGLEENLRFGHPLIDRDFRPNGVKVIKKSSYTPTPMTKPENNSWMTYGV